MYILFFLIIFPPFFYYVYKLKPSIIICNLVGYLPLVLKLFNKKLRYLILFKATHGLHMKKIIWNLLYVKSDLLITMTELTKNKIRNQFPDIKNITKSIIQLLMTVYLRNRVLF